MATITLQRLARFEGNQQRQIVGPITGARYTVNNLGQVTVSTLDAGDLKAQGWGLASGGAGGSTLSGTATLDFGAFPGSDFASVDVTTPNANDADAVLFAFVPLTASDDHSADEHLVDPPQVAALNNGDGTITIKAVPRPGPASPAPGAPMPYGKWTVGYAFLQ